MSQVGGADILSAMGGVYKRPNSNPRHNAAVLDQLTTEQRNSASDNVDQLSSMEIVQLMNREDQTVPEAVGR